MPKRPRHTVRTLVFSYVATLGAMALALDTLSYLHSRAMLAKELDQRIERRMAALEQDFAQGGQARLVRSIEQLSHRGARAFAYLLVDARGAPIIRTGGIESAPSPGWSELEVRDLDDVRIDPARLLTHRLANGSILTVMADRDFIDEFDWPFTFFKVGVFALTLLFAAAGGVALEGVMRRRLKAIDDTARAIVAGDTRSRVAISPHNDEFDALATKFNATLDRMEGLLADVRRVTGYIAHDLRTPLVRLRDLLAKAQPEAGGTGVAEPIGRAIAACDELLEIHDAILAIGRIEAEGVGEWQAPVDLSALVVDLAESYAVVALDGGQTLTWQVAPGIRIVADRISLSQALVNLLENAVRHTPAGTAIAVSLDRHAGGARLTIADSGPATSAEERAAMLEGRRVAGAQVSSGALGLRLVQAIVAAHGGSIILGDNRPGLTIAIELPQDGPSRARVREGWLSRAADTR